VEKLEIGLVGMYCINFTQDIDRRQAFLNTVMNFWFHEGRGGTSRLDELLLVSQEDVLLYGVSFC
jgi:hypothetical protein